MHVEVDMSGRVEETNRPTALAFANGSTASIRIKATEKQKVLLTLKRYKPERSIILHHVLVFATLLYFLFQNHADELHQIIIDPEYQGYEPTIKEHVLNLFRRHKITLKPDTVSFHRVGKKSPAHKLAFRIYKGLVRPDKVVTAEDVLVEFGIKK